MRLITDDAIAICTIWQESRNQPFEGMVAVGEVIRERVWRHYNCDGTVIGACLAAFQFSGWNTQDPNRIPSLKLDDSNHVVNLCKEAWWKSQSLQYAKGAVLYCNLKTVHPRPSWAKEEKIVAVIGDHTFFSD